MGSFKGCFMGFFKGSFEFKGFKGTLGLILGGSGDLVREGDE